jgi:hypothetical protein
MVGPSVKGVKAEYIVVFALGIVFLGLGVYAMYHLITVELPSGRFTSLPFAAGGLIILGLLIIRQTYPIFYPEKNRFAESRVCPFCGALVVDTADLCEKCGRQLEPQR